jgi:DNA-binding transcriptional LysR family regulator
VVVAAPGHPLAGRRVAGHELTAATWLLGPSVLDEHGVAAGMLRRFNVPERNQRIFQSHAAALTEARRGGLGLASAQHVATDLTDGRLVRVETVGSQADGVWSVFTLGRDKTPPTAAELTRFVSTPRAMQAMLEGSGANISHFRPSVHVTLWS